MPISINANSEGRVLEGRAVARFFLSTEAKETSALSPKPAWAESGSRVLREGAASPLQLWSAASSPSGVRGGAEFWPPNGFHAF